MVQFDAAAEEVGSDLMKPVGAALTDTVMFEVQEAHERLQVLLPKESSSGSQATLVFKIVALGKRSCTRPEWVVGCEPGRARLRQFARDGGDHFGSA